MNTLETRELHKIAKRVNERERLIDDLKSKTSQVASSAVAEAILQGQDLIKARALVPSGCWLDWLAANCPRIHDSTARRYMTVARNCARVHDSSSLRQALALLAKDNSPASSSRPKECPEHLQILYLFSRAVKYSLLHSFKRCPEETKAELRKELEPLVMDLWPERFRPVLSDASSRL